MPPAASFGERWARDNLTRPASPLEIKVLNLFPLTCGGDEGEASKRAKRYYHARGPAGLTDLWHKRHPDDEDILSSCQDAYIIPLRVRSFSGQKVTLVRLPASTALERPLSVRALLARWLMILDIRLREDQDHGDEVVVIDVQDLHPSHLKDHFRGSYWKDFISCIKTTYPRKFSDVHVINTHRLKTLPILMLHFGIYPWKRKITQLYPRIKHLDQVLGANNYSEEALPFEYGGKAGSLKDLNDEWTKKLLSNSKWLVGQERKFYGTVLKPETRQRSRHKSSVRTKNASYDLLTRTHSCRSLHKQNDHEEGTYGAYRTFKVTSDHGFYE